MIHLVTIKTKDKKWVICSSDCVGKYRKYEKPVLGSAEYHRYQLMAQAQAQWQDQQVTAAPQGYGGLFGALFGGL